MIAVELSDVSLSFYKGAIHWPFTWNDKIIRMHGIDFGAKKDYGDPIPHGEFINKYLGKLDLDELEKCKILLKLSDFDSIDGALYGHKFNHLTLEFNGEFFKHNRTMLPIDSNVLFLYLNSKDVY